MRTVNSPVGSTPMPVSRSRSALRIISPAPASRINASAIWAVTSTARASIQRVPLYAFPFFSASTGRSIDACAAGSSDTSMAVSSATPPVNTIVIASRPIIDAPMRVNPDAPAILGVPGATAERKNTSGSGMTAAAAPSSANATNSPPAAPSADNTTPSARNCRMMRPRLAPIATRTATSRRRAIALAATRFVRFTHAISSTTPTAPSSTSAARRTSVSTRDAYMELARAFHPGMPMSWRGCAASI